MFYHRITNAVRHLMVAAGFIVLCSCGAQLSPEELLERARGALAAGDLDAAVIDVKSALQQAPMDAVGRELYGEIFKRQRNLSFAAEEFRRSLDASFDPDVAVIYAKVLVDAGEAEELRKLSGEGFFDAVVSNASYLAARARAEIANGDMFAAGDTLQQAEELDASSPDVRRVRALLTAQHGGDLAAGADMLARLVEEHPDDADAWSLYGSILQAEGKLDDATEAFSRAGELNPYRLPDRLNHILLLLDQKRYDEVRAAIVPLDAQIPNNPAVNYTQARLAMLDSDMARALEELNEALKAAPQHAPSLYFAANANLNQGNLATAQSQIESFLALRPRNVGARVMLATIHLRSGAYQRALSIAQELLGDVPENESVRIVYARALASNGRLMDSAEELGKLVAENSDSPTLRSEYADALLRAGDAERSAIQYGEAVALAPEEPGLRTRLVNALLLAGDKDAARRSITDFKSAFPASPEPEILLATLSISEDNSEQARQHLNAALEVDPGNSEARRRLAGIAMLESDADTAVELLGQDLSDDTPALQNLLALAGVEERRGDFKAMEIALRRAIDTYPEALTPRLFLGRYVLRDGRPGEAVDLLSEVRESHSDDPGVQEVLLSAFLALEQPGPAVSAARRMVAIAPDNAQALQLAAVAELANNNVREAAALLQEAVRLTPDSMELRSLLIETLFVKGDMEAISDELAGLSDAFSGPELIDFARGSVSLRMVDPAAGEAFLRQAHERRPSGASLLLLSQALIQNQKVDETLTVLNDWMVENPEDVLALSQIGAVHAARGEDALAATAYKDLLTMMPDDVIVMNNLAWTLRASDNARALELVRAALAESPASPAILDTQAMVLMHAGEYEKALAVLDDVQATVGDNVPSLAFHRAQILAAAERNEEARMILSDLIDLPPFPEQRQAVELLESL